MSSDLKVHVAKNIVYKENIFDISDYKFNLSKAEITRREKYKSKQKLINAIREDYKNNFTIAQLEEKYNCYFKTIKRYLYSDSTRVITVKTTELDNYSGTIYECLKEKDNIHQIYQKIVDLGYTSSYPNFFKQLKIRLMTNTLGNTFQLSRYSFCKLLYRNNIKILKLNEENTQALQEYLKQDNLEHDILNLANEFREMFIKRDSSPLDEWIKKYQNHYRLEKFRSFQTFIKGIINDKKAVKEQIENEITNGLAEGLVCKLKLVKRRTYGRCSFELLRCLLLQ